MNTFFIRMKMLILASPFSYLQEGKDFTTDENIRGTAASFHKLMMALTVIGLVVSIFSACYIEWLKRNSNDRSENKSSLLSKLFVGVCIFGFASLFGVFHSAVKVFS